MEPGLFVEPRAYASVKNLPNFTDVSPRIGVSYDLFGTGQTAVKASFGRYVAKMGTIVALNVHPVTTSIKTALRSWSDANGNFIPDCVLKNLAANGECGAISNVNFGGTNTNAITYADDMLSGFGQRDYFWDVSAEVTQDIGGRASTTAGYYRNWSDHFGSQNIGWPTGHPNNLAVTPADYTPYCITAPLDPQLPGGGGYEVCGLADVNPDKFGQGNIRIERASNFGGKKRSSDFFTFSLNTRLGGGADVGASLDTGRTVEDLCFLIDSPQQLLNCRVVTPFKAQTQIKAYASYALPHDFVVSGVFQNVSGINFRADYRAPNSAILPSLGRNLSSCGTRVVCTATASVPLVAPQTLFEPRRTMVDLRVSKIFLVARTRLRANLDIYNALNRSDILTINNNFGGGWRLPRGASGGSSLLNGRTMQLSGEVSF